MRRALALLVVAAVAAVAAAGPPETDVFRPFEEEADEGPEVLEPDLGELPAAARLVLERRLAELRAHRWRIRVSVVRVDRVPAGLAPLASSAAALLSATDEQSLRNALRAGDARLEQTAEASGSFEELHAEAEVVRHAPLRWETESRVGCVTTLPLLDVVHAGLVFDGRLRHVAGDGVDLVYSVRCGARPRIEERPVLGTGRLTAEVDGVAASGVLRIRAGETAVLRAVEPDGGAWFVLLRLSGGGRMDAIEDLGPEWALCAGGHLAAETVPKHRAWDGPPLEPGEDWDAQDEIPDAWADLFAAAEAYGADHVLLPGGLAAVRVAREDRGELERLLTAGAAARGTRGSLVAAAPGVARMTVPCSPGAGVGWFAGRVAARWSGVEGTSGCQDSVLAEVAHVWHVSGAGGAGRVRPDGTADVTVEGRHATDPLPRSFTTRRMLAEYAGVVSETLTLPLTSDSGVVLETAVPAGPTTLAGGVTIGWTAPAPTHGLRAARFHELGAIPTGSEGWFVTDDGRDESSAELTRLRVAGIGDVFARGESTVRIRWADRRPVVRAWRSDGNCGMRLRLPEIDTVGERTDVKIRLYQDAYGPRVDVEAELRGTPERVGSHDPGDGAVELLREPYLRARAVAVPLTDDVRIAWGAGLEVRINGPVAAEPGATPEHPALAIEVRDGGRYGLVTGRPAGSYLEAGGMWLLPADFDLYSSNHGSSEGTTQFVPVHDGVAVALRDLGGATMLALDVRSRPETAPQTLHTITNPVRDGTDLTLLRVRRMRRPLRLFVEDGGTLDHADGALHVEARHHLPEER